MNDEPIFAVSFYPGGKTFEAYADFHIIRDGRSKRISTKACANKREAREWAEGLGAQPWNF
jgi:hypothetical protein